MSVWEQRQYDALPVGRQASQDREQQPSVAAHIIWEALYILTVDERCKVSVQECEN